MSVSELGWSGPGGRCSLFFCLVSKPGWGDPASLFFLLGIWDSFFCLVTVTGQVSGPGALFFCFVSEPGWRGPGALFFFPWCLSQVRFFFFAWFLAQVRGVAADGG